MTDFESNLVRENLRKFDISIAAKQLRADREYWMMVA